MSVAAVVTILGGTRAAVFAGVAAGLLLVSGVQTVRLSVSASKLEAAESRESLWKQANTGNVDAIKKLREANKGWSSLADQRAAGAAAAVKRVEAERDTLATELEQARRARRKTYETDKPAAAWGRTVVPAASADQLRKGNPAH